MGYSTGSATGPTDLLDKLRAFLLSDGWTINDHSSSGTGYRLHVQKSADSSTEMYFNFRSAIAENIFGDSNSEEVTGIGINGSTGYNAGNDWDEQPGYSLNKNYGNYAAGCAITDLSISAIPAYYFFSVGDSVHVVVEVTSGEYQFMSFGLLNKQGSYTGGQYFSASYSSYRTETMRIVYPPSYFATTSYFGSVDEYIFGYVYVDVDSAANWRMAESYGTNAEIIFPAINPNNYSPSYGNGGLACMFGAKAPNFYNNIASLCPLYTCLYRSDTNYSLLGWPEGVRFLNTTNYSVGQEVTYGSETWKIFRTSLVNGVAPAYFTNYGFAFKKVV